MPQGSFGQVVPGDQGYMVRWDYSYSSWTLFTCEIEMLLHVVSTAGEPAPTPAETPPPAPPPRRCSPLTPPLLSPSLPDVILHCERVKPILDLVHKVISTDWTVSDCLLPITSRIYMLLQR